MNIQQDKNNREIQRKYQSTRIITVLACSGRVIRLLEHSRVRQTIELDSVPTVLHIPQGRGDKFVCGFADGKIVMYYIGHLGSESIYNPIY